jgi:hypothetical protein
VKATFRAIILIAVVAIILLCWAPWITYDFAVTKVVEEMGGPDANFVYSTKK